MSESRFIAHEIVQRVIRQYPAPFVYTYWDEQSRGVSPLLITFLLGPTPEGPTALYVGGSGLSLLLFGDLSTFQRVRDFLLVALPRIQSLISELIGEDILVVSAQSRPVSFAHLPGQVRLFDTSLDLSTPAGWHPEVETPSETLSDSSGSSISVTELDTETGGASSVEEYSPVPSPVPHLDRPGRGLFGYL